jgi:hypothetical protein
MAYRATIIEKEVGNRLALITGTDVIDAVNALSNAEMGQLIADLKAATASGSVRDTLLKQIKQTLRTAVAAEVDGYIAAGAIPVSFLTKTLG